jgi:hypothetical protein
MPAREENSLASLLYEAKSFFEAEPDEPLLPTDLVLLRELAYALERLRGATRTSLKEKSNLEVYSIILEDLCDGKLVAETFEERAVIPSEEWGGFSREQRPAFESRFWVGPLFLHAGSEKFEGKLPILPLNAAVDWLIEKSKPQQKRRFENKKQTEEAFKAWVGEFDGLNKPTVRERETWYLEHGISRGRGRELVRQFAPPHWSRPGRNPST